MAAFFLPMFLENQTIKHSELASIDFNNMRLEECEFVGCDFTGVNLTNAKFMDCTFTECNLSSIQLVNVSFQDVVFEKCKLLGLLFDQCSTLLLSIHFKNSALDHSAFLGMDLRKFRFDKCSIQGADFSNSNASGVSFQDCNLADAVFDTTDLTRADFQTAYNFQFNPTYNQVKGARFSKENAQGLLAHFGIKID